MGEIQIPRLLESLQDEGVVNGMRESLVELLRGDPRLFSSLFSPTWKHGRASAIREEGLSRGQRELIALVEELGLLEIEEAGIRSVVRITPWSGAFYLADHDDAAGAQTVAGPQVETRYFTTMMQVRPGDRVLDLGTGCGILLLEAARRGAEGVGVDCSPRALAFARVNAALNGLGGRVDFVQGDMRECRPKDLGISPDVLLCAPPSEPVPDGAASVPDEDATGPAASDPTGWPHVVPLHAAGGRLGSEVVDATLEKFRSWVEADRPLVAQVLTWSLGRRTEGGGRHLLLRDALVETARDLRASLDVLEPVPPSEIEDYLVLRYGGGRHSVGGDWLADMEADGFQRLHLLFSSFYRQAKGQPGASGQTAIRFVPHDLCPAEDQALSGRRLFETREAVEGFGFREATGQQLYTKFLKDVITAREERASNESVSLSLTDPQVYTHLARLLRSRSLFFGQDPLLVLDLRFEEASRVRLAGAVLVKQGEATPLSSRLFEAEQLAASCFGETLGITWLAVYNEPPYIRSGVSAGRFTDLAASFATLPRDARGVVQAFYVLTPPDGCLTPIRRHLFTNVFSELADAASLVALERRLKTEKIERELFDAFAHTAFNTLRTIKSGLYCEEFGDQKPPQRLRFRLVDPDSGAPLPDMENRLVEALNQIWAGEQATAGALSLGRIVARGGRTTPKQRAAGDYSVLDAVRTAEGLVSSYGYGFPKTYEIELDRQTLEGFTIPAGYLNAELLSTIIYELLLNGYRHAPLPIRMQVSGEPAEHGGTLLVRTRLREESTLVEWEERDGITLPAEEWPTNERRSFLFRFKRVSKVLGGAISIDTTIDTLDDEQWYVSRLNLGPLRDDQGAALAPRVDRPGKT